MSWFLIAFGVLWLGGWMLFYFKTSACQEPTLWGKIKMAALLFFMWPLICWEMASHGDV